MKEVGTSASLCMSAKIHKSRFRDMLPRCGKLPESMSPRRSVCRTSADQCRSESHCKSATLRMSKTRGRRFPKLYRSLMSDHTYSCSDMTGSERMCG
jgi:hypothetical protein